MLKIKSISYKNILSNGNHLTKIDFDSHLLLGVGHNGSGKSTITSALVFALYGKDFRGIKKNGLLNSINKKNLLVECEFEVSGVEYKVVRGIKPDIFELYIAGVKKDKDSAKKDMQKHLEEQILRFPYNSFKQIVIAGSGQHIPFMKLSTQQRREFIENLLEINVFTVMSSILKDRISKNNDDLSISKNSLSILVEKYKFFEEQSKKGDDETKEKIAEIDSKISEMRDKIDTLNNEINDCENVIMKIDSKISNLSEKTKDYDDFRLKKMSYFNDIKSKKETIDKISSLDSCPLCLSGVTHEHKLSIKKTFDNEIRTIKKEYDIVSDSLSNLEKILSEKEALVNKKSEIATMMMKKNFSLNGIRDSIESLASERKTLSEKKTNEVDSLKILKSEMVELREKINGLAKNQLVFSQGSVILKDTGIKSVIIKKYVTLLNDLVNLYLSKFNFYISYMLDENFNEVIKSRYRDDFTYENFSEGEKARIDLSLLFAFRTLAQMKSSLNCDLLILDETLDAALDSDGIDDLKSIFDWLSDTKLFVISHREQAKDAINWDRIYTFKKVSNFSTMEITR